MYMNCVDMVYEVLFPEVSNWTTIVTSHLVLFLYPAQFLNRVNIMECANSKPLIHTTTLLKDIDGCLSLSADVDSEGVSKVKKSCSKICGKFCGCNIV